MFIPFELPRPRPGQIDDTELLDSCSVAGDAVPIFIRLGKLFEEANRVEIDHKVSDVFLQNGVEVSVRVQRTYTMLLLFTLQVTSVSDTVPVNEVYVQRLSNDRSTVRPSAFS